MSIALELDRELWSIIDAPRRRRGRPLGSPNKPKALGSCNRNNTPNVRQHDREAQMILMRETGSTLEEIGVAFGVTRERARQLLLRHGPAQKGRAVSVDAIAVLRAARAPGVLHYDEIPAACGVAAGDAYRALNALGVRSALMRLYRLRRRREAVLRIQAFVARVGRVPFSSEIGQGLNPKHDQTLPHGTSLQMLFGSIRAAILAAGFVPRRVGEKGEKPPREFCKHGHAWTPENTYTYPKSGAKFCRTCMAAKSRARYARRVK